MSNNNNYKVMSISALTIAAAKDWKHITNDARAFLLPLKTLKNLDLDYDKKQVSHFLSHADTWEGEVADAIKKELRRRIKYPLADVRVIVPKVVTDVE